MKAAILLLHVGGGHMEAANNVKHQLESRGVETEIVDGLEYTPQWFARFFKWWWLTMQNKTPKLWGWFYESKFFSSSIFSVWMYHVPWWGMRRIVREMKPDMVFTTHFVGNAVALRVRKKSKIPLKLNYIVTEYVWHPAYFWWPDADRYHISSDVIKGELDKRGFDPSKITMSGIPIKAAFEDAPEKADARKELDIPLDATVLFFFAGTFGGTSIESLVNSLEGKDVYPVVVCGRNEEAKTSIEALFEEKKIEGKVYGFVDFMHLIMRSSDLMVGKGGALMCAECLATGTPVLLYGSPPGHELGNAEHLEALGAGIVTETIDDVLRCINELLEDPERLAKMREAALAAGAPDAATRVVEAAMADVKQLSAG